MDYYEDLSEEDNYDEHYMTDYEMLDLIGGYKSDESPIEVEDEATVIVCDKIKNTKEEKCTYVIIVKRA